MNFTDLLISPFSFFKLTLKFYLLLTALSLHFFGGLSLVAAIGGLPFSAVCVCLIAVASSVAERGFSANEFQYSCGSRV